MNEKGKSTLKICEQKLNYLNYSKRTIDNYLSHINRFLKSQSILIYPVRFPIPHPDRIHFCYEINDCYNLIRRFKLSDKLNGDDFNYTILKVNCIDLKDKIILHTDPNFLEGCFTYDNIDPKYLENIA